MRWQLLVALAASDLRVRELVERVGQPQNLVSYHLRLLREGGLVTAARSTHDGRETYYHLDLDRCAQAMAGAGAALHPGLRLTLHPEPYADSPVVATGPNTGRPRAERTSVLFVCTGNTARSPVAEALLSQRCAGRLTVHSCGTRPRARLQPHTVRVLADRFGVDVRDRRPRGLDSITGHRFDHVVTLCDKAREHLPELAGRPQRTHWSIPEPPADSYPAFECTAAEIDTRIRHLLPVILPSDRWVRHP